MVSRKLWGGGPDYQSVVETVSGVTLRSYQERIRCPPCDIHNRMLTNKGARYSWDYALLSAVTFSALRLVRFSKLPTLSQMLYPWTFDRRFCGCYCWGISHWKSMETLSSNPLIESPILWESHIYDPEGTQLRYEVEVILALETLAAL